MKKVIITVFCVNIFLSKAQNVGIGTTAPLARLHVADSNVLFAAPGRVLLDPGNTPISGTGRRMMWYPDKAAFRAGYISGAEWDKSNIGYYSFASGANTIAFGNNSIAMGSGSQAVGDSAAIAIGYGVKASGSTAVAFGKTTNASGRFSTAMGWNTTASGLSSLATGYSSLASGDLSTAMGLNSIASEYTSTAIGAYATASGGGAMALGSEATASGTSSFAAGERATASGFHSIAIGELTKASGRRSTAIGFQANTNDKYLAVCISGSVIPTLNSVDSQMMMRFSNYTFWVTPSSYAYLIPASNGWAYTSDKNKKERFEEINGEAVLQKISTIPFYSWNFKDTRQYRHYGIMAQDFFYAFGKDSYGYIGNDTTVSPLDLLGVNMAAIKALENRSNALSKENKKLKIDNLALESRIKNIEIQWADKIAKLEAKLNQLLTATETYAKQ